MRVHVRECVRVRVSVRSVRVRVRSVRVRVSVRMRVILAIFNDN